MNRHNVSPPAVIDTMAEDTFETGREQAEMLHDSESDLSKWKQW